MGSPVRAARQVAVMVALVAAAGAVPGCSPAADHAPAATATITVEPMATATATPSPEVSGAVPHILVIMEENHGYATTVGDCGADSPDPYLCSLASEYASLTQWYGVQHPSLPNYIDLASGADQGCTSDSCSGPYTATNLGEQLATAGIPWAAYMESMPSPCFTGVSSGEYVLKHNPFIVFADVTDASDCAQVEVPYPGASRIAAALDAPGAPDFVWITPNLQDDMHDGTVQEGDAWLRANLTTILGSSWFADDGTIIITMDENDDQPTGACCGDAAAGRIPMVVISRNSLGKGSVGLIGDHFGTLRSIEEVYGLPLLGAADDPANGDISGLFGSP
jgi:acid phosphatase